MHEITQTQIKDKEQVRHLQENLDLRNKTCNLLKYTPKNKLHNEKCDYNILTTTVPKYHGNT